MSEETNTKQTIENSVEDLVADFLYYDRKEDEDLPVGAIQEAIESGEISEGDIVAKFNECLRRSLLG